MTKSRESPDDFFLEEVTDARVREYTHTRNADTWRNLLSVEDYVLRERVLSLTNIVNTGKNRLVVFVLRSKDAPETPLCSCEILIRESWRYSAQNGKVSRSDILSGCIGGVYTYPENRGRGLATIMIDKLVETVKLEEYIGTSGFTFLYSEVGEFYTRNGFQSQEVKLSELPLSPSDSPCVLPLDMHMVKFHEFDGLFEEYAVKFDKKTRRETSPGHDQITIAPSAHYADWFHMRAKYFGATLFGNVLESFDFSKETFESLSRKFENIEPVFFGIKRVCPQTGKNLGFIVWQYEYGFDDEKQVFKNYATIIKTHVASDDDDETAVALITAMKSYLEAKHDIPQLSNFYKIVLWESELPASVMKTVADKFGARQGLENGSRSAILFNNPADDELLKLGKMVWAENTKLPWF